MYIILCDIAASLEVAAIVAAQLRWPKGLMLDQYCIILYNII